MSDVVISRRHGALNLTVHTAESVFPHCYTISFDSLNSNPVLQIQTGQTNGDGKVIESNIPLGDIDPREHAIKHAEIAAIVTNALLGEVQDTEQRSIVAKVPPAPLPELEPEEPEYLYILEDFPRYEDFIGLDSEIEQLQNAADLFFTPPELLKKYGQKPGAVLLHGPGGVGKTALVQATAKQYRFDYRTYEFNDFSDAGLGVPQRKLQSIYDEAGSAGHPVMIFFDNCDGIFKKDAGGNPGRSLSLVATLKSILDRSQEYPNVLSVFAANSLGGFDKALLGAGRFNTILPIEQPNDKVRVATFLGKLIQQSDHFVTNLVMPDVADDYEFAIGSGRLEDAISNSANFTAADFETVFRKLRAIRMKHEKDTGEEPPLLTAQQLIDAIVAHNKSKLV